MSSDVPSPGSGATPRPPEPPDVVASRLVAVVESSDDAIVSKTLEGIVTTWNPGAERIFGWRAEEVIGRSILTVIPSERHAEEPEILQRIAQGERIEHFETVRVRKDGARIDVDLTVSPIRDATGQVVGVSKIARDVTARRQAELALTEERRTLALLNETGTLIAAEVGLERVVQAVTDASTRIAGAAFGAFFYNVVDANGESYQLYTISGVPRSAFEHFPLPRNTPIFAPTFAGQAVIRLDDVRKDPRYGKVPPHHGMPAGHLPVCSYLAVPVVSRSGEVIGGLFFGHPEPAMFPARLESVLLGVAAQAALAIDNARLYEAAQKLAAERAQLLDSERRARAQAERASTTKDEFLSTLSHELRTPLNAILGWTQLLQRQDAPVSLADGLAVIERNAQTQAQLVDDLLDMGRIEAGKMRLDVQELDLRELVQSACETVMHSAQARGIRIETLLDSLAGPVRGDATRLRQCVWNLLTNAIKFTPRGGKVQVLLTRVNSHVEIAVSDTGQGIEAGFLPFVFERFRQADGTSTRRQGGLGLGLAIVKNLVELHGGSVSATSPGTGLGATFTIALPVMAAVPRSELTPPPRDPPSTETGTYDSPSLGGLTVLVVDDEGDGRSLVAQVLASAGARVTEASSVDEALVAFGAQRFDVVLSDIGMPGRDGFELIRTIRTAPLEGGGRTPAVALTAFARAEDRTRCLRAGFQAHLAKPVNLAELLALVASLTGR